MICLKSCDTILVYCSREFSLLAYFTNSIELNGLVKEDLVHFTWNNHAKIPISRIGRSFRSHCAPLPLPRKRIVAATLMNKIRITFWCVPVDLFRHKKNYRLIFHASVWIKTENVWICMRFLNNFAFLNEESKIGESIPLCVVVK